jgi:ribulose kinase
MAFTLGIDYGTNSVRTIIVDCSDGQSGVGDIFNWSVDAVSEDPRLTIAARFTALNANQIEF